VQGSSGINIGIVSNFTKLGVVGGKKGELNENNK